MKLKTGHIREYKSNILAGLTRHYVSAGCLSSAFSVTCPFCRADGNGVLRVYHPELMRSDRVHLAYQVVLHAHCPVLTLGTEFHFNS
jgi:hypothetical protein